MKLYAYQPDGHGEMSFFTIAESEEKARQVIDKHIKEKYFKDGKYLYAAGGWETDYYILTVAEVGEVIENHND